MQKENQQIRKNEARLHFLKLRSAISKENKEVAANKLVELLSAKGRILSFYSFGSEIDLFPLNALLAHKKRLMSTCLENGILVPYHIEDEDGLLISSLGVYEPNPKTSCRAKLEEIDMILVPALAFDRSGYRLGYGKGHYDRFLQTVGNILTIGVGFKEQLSKAPLPRDPWDTPVQDLILV